MPECQWVSNYGMLLNGLKPPFCGHEPVEGSYYCRWHTYEYQMAQVEWKSIKKRLSGEPKQ